jgi:hypothetical protein
MRFIQISTKCSPTTDLRGIQASNESKATKSILSYNQSKGRKSQEKVSYIELAALTLRSGPLTFYVLAGPQLLDCLNRAPLVVEWTHYSRQVHLLLVWLFFREL